MAIGELDDLDLQQPIPRAGSAEVRALAAALDEGVLQRERDRIPPHEQVKLIRAARLGAHRLPRRVGGADRSFRELLDIVIDLSEADPNLAHSLRNHFVFFEAMLNRPDGGKGAERWLEEAARGALFGSAGAESTAPQAGGKVQNMQGTFVESGDGYVLNATKLYSTGNMYCDYLVVPVVASDGTTVSAVVPADRQGVVHIDDWDGFGQELTGSGTTRFDDVHVDASEVLVRPTSWGDETLYFGTLPQLYLTAVIAGIAQRIKRDAVDVVRGRSRTYYHAPTETAAEDPILQETVGRIASNAFALRAMVLAAADALDEATRRARVGEPDGGAARDAAIQAAEAKLVGDELALHSATILFDVGSASTVRRGLQLDRHWRNIRTISSHNPPGYKAMRIGDTEINDTDLPRWGFF